MENKEIIEKIKALRILVNEMEKGLIGQDEPTKPATPAVPDGYELLTIDENTKIIEGDMVYTSVGWVPMGTEYANTYKELHKRINAYSDFYCRPIKKPWNPEWYLEGNTFLHANGFTGAAYADSHNMINAGFHFESHDKAIVYYDWLTKNAGHLRALQILEDRIKELNEGWEPDHSISTPKYTITIDCHSGKAVVEDIYIKYYYPDSLLFKTESIGQQLISEFGEDFIKQALNF